MEPIQLLEILKVAARLKTTYRHCYTEENRRESVADHSYRIALMGMLLSHVPEYADYDMNKVIRMCLIHDLGEAFTGDIPSFEKTNSDSKTEAHLFDNWVSTFPDENKKEWQELLLEMNALETKEAKLYKALDKIEAIISHNESDISTWLPLEYDLQLAYGQDNMKFSEYMMNLRKEIDVWTREKIENEGC